MMLLAMMNTRKIASGLGFTWVWLPKKMGSIHSRNPTMRKPMKSFVTEDPCFWGVLGVVLGMLAFFVGGCDGIATYYTEKT